ncbi:MAG: hypothetical protein V4510_09955 [bacterium]
MATCTGQKINDDGTFYCDRTTVAAYSWDGVPFNYKGKPGAAVCSGHEAQLQTNATKYPGLTLIERLEQPSVLHAFEKSGLGRAPFKFIGCEERRGPMLLGVKNGVEMWAGAPGQPMGTCAHCGTGIAVCCTIESADGKRFIVGNVCVNKTGDKGLIKTTRKAINQRNRERNHALAKARRLWITENLERAKPGLTHRKHPNGFAEKNAYDWAVWMLKNAGDQGLMGVEKLIKVALEEVR